MKIADVQTQVLRSYEYPDGGWVLVRVHTDDGVEGVGECFVPNCIGRSIFAAKDLIDHRLAPEVVGQSVLETHLLWERMYSVCGAMYDRRGLAIHSLSGVDMAVCDAAAESLGIPLHQLLGGCFRDRVRVYVSSIWVDPQRPGPSCELTRQYVSEGFTGIKYFGWPDFGADTGRDQRILRGLREAAGEGVDLMLDLGRPYGLSEAIATARMIETSGADVYWWEEPFAANDDDDSMARLVARTDVTIAAGERELTAFAFRDMIQKQTADLLQPDLSWVGGLTEGRRIAELARLHNLPLVPHNWGTMVNFAASIHLVASMPRGFLCEYPLTPRVREAPAPQHIPSPMMTELAAEPVPVVDGHAIVPQTPGLGIELDEEAVARHTVR